MQGIKSEVEKILGDEMSVQTGAAYLVPQSWWEETCLFNFDAKMPKDLVFPHLNLANYIDPFLLDFEDAILSELEHKSNYLKFSKTTLSPEIKRNVKWKVISASLWTRITQYLHSKISLLVFYDCQNPSACFTEPCVQVQMIFCAKNKSEAYVGFLPESCELVAAVRSIGYELGFIEMENSRIVFPQNCSEKLFYFFEFEKKAVSEIPDTLVMAFNMETSEPKVKDFSFGKKDATGDSNQAVAGEQDILQKSWEHLRNDGTMSTGAETPSFIFSEQNNTEFRVRELIREKKPEQISQMKIYAQKCINGPLIPIRPLSQEQLQLQLQAIALEIVQSSHHKKKNFKEKQIE